MQKFILTILLFLIITPIIFSQDKTGKVIYFEIEGLTNLDVDSENIDFQLLTQEMYLALKEKLSTTFQLETINPSIATTILSKNAQASKSVKKLKKKQTKELTGDAFNFKIIISLTEKGLEVPGPAINNKFVFIRIGVFDNEGTLLYLSEDYEFSYNSTTSDNFDGRVYRPKKMDFRLEDFKTLFEKELEELNFFDASMLEDY